MVKVLCVVLLAGCSIGGVDFTGKACPCPDGYQCETSTQTCARDVTAADGNADTPAIDSCLATPFGHLAYSTPTFSDFTSAWNAGGGNWSQSQSEVVQSNALSPLSFLYHPVNLADVRIVATMHATSGGMGKAIELTLRVDAAGSNMYHCNWEPEGGAFLIQRTDDVDTGQSIKDTVVDTNAIAGYSITDPVTMEFQASGTSFACCLRNITGASVSGDDPTYGTGDVGLKTYLMSGGYSDFQLFTP